MEEESVLGHGHGGQEGEGGRRGVCIPLLFTMAGWRDGGTGGKAMFFQRHGMCVYVHVLSMSGQRS